MNEPIDILGYSDKKESGNLTVMIAPNLITLMKKRYSQDDGSETEPQMQAFKREDLLQQDEAWNAAEKQAKDYLLKLRQRREALREMMNDYNSFATDNNYPSDQNPVTLPNLQPLF